MICEGRVKTPGAVLLQICPRREEASLSNVTAVRTCAICGNPVSLEYAKTDEDGQTVHEQCYVLKVKGKQDAPVSGARETGSRLLAWNC
jgi:hypothetical protein